MTSEYEVYQLNRRRVALANDFAREKAKLESGRMAWFTRKQLDLHADERMLLKMLVEEFLRSLEPDKFYDLGVHVTHEVARRVLRKLGNP